MKNKALWFFIVIFAIKSVKPMFRSESEADDEKSSSSSSEQPLEQEVYFDRIMSSGNESGGKDSLQAPQENSPKESNNLFFKNQNASASKRICFCWVGCCCLFCLSKNGNDAEV